MTAEMLTSTRELHSRTADGLDVRLLWCQASNQVYVTLIDRKTGDSFCVEVPEGERALHVFEHPYAYAPRPARYPLAVSATR